MLVCQQSELVIVITSFSYTQHGRDVNAARNILRKALKMQNPLP